MISIVFRIGRDLGYSVRPEEARSAVSKNRFLSSRTPIQPAAVLALEQGALALQYFGERLRLCHMTRRNAVLRRGLQLKQTGQSRTDCQVGWNAGAAREENRRWH
jgi:hypothetical protein